jgi:CHAT domain-containing protein
LLHEVGVPAKALVVAESSRLPHAAVEADYVASLFPQSKTLVDERATLAALGSHASDADVIHFACHGEFRGDSPMFSALRLADGPLSVEAAQRLELHADIVVLSACETGLAEAAHGDEMVGLVRAFLVAGSARVLASLWPVGDRIALQFMTSFYAALRAGTSPSAALRLAQEALRKEHPHPFHWAAFVLHGGW